MLYSIGYATKPFDVFVDQLKRHNIDVVADVRSVPFSKVFFDYHQPSLKKALPLHGFRYVYLGKELGPRSEDVSHYNDEGQVQFDRLMESSLFKEGIVRLQNGLEKELNIALLCAEKDPSGCHRSLLISYFLKRHAQLEIWHIDHEGDLESQTALEKRLVSIQQLEEDLFTSPEDLQRIAYDRQLQQTSYKK